MSRYSIGVDFGTLSARTLLLDLQTGAESAVSEYIYPHGVLDTTLPCGTPLGADWALQVPQDYLDALYSTIPQVLAQGNVPAEEVVGIGIDFTSCSVMPVTADGTPLCQLPQLAAQPHAYPKLWKHHAAQYCADIVNEVAIQRHESWLPLYGGKISSEWMIPKILQMVKESPALYTKADRILECGDWVVWQLCGKEVRSACNAGYKGLWHYKNGYPSPAYFKALDTRMENVVQEKLSTDIAPLGAKAGTLTAEMAARTGLCAGTAVAVGIIDAHASVPACRIDGPGQMLMTMGTSTCHMLLSDAEYGVPGSCGIVKDGILPGFFGYEAGQSCVGDLFSWFIKECVPAHYTQEAEKAGISMHRFLRAKAQQLQPGESGLLALDWWNGVRSVLMNFDLSGLILGLTLQTKPEEIYRALIEATAFGTRRIIDAFESVGVPVHSLYAAGGIAVKDPFTMQIYADICKRPIKICGSAQSGALGSAIFGAVAAGKEASGFDDAATAARVLGKVQQQAYQPILENSVIYDRLYADYLHLHNYFGTGGNEVMLRLKQMKAQAHTEKAQP